ncbi:MAG: BatD family protein, partial [Chitinophagales bacterium]
MNLKTKFLLFLSVLSSSIWAQKIEVQISAKKIEAGEILTVQFNLTNQNERGMIRGSFEPFQLVGGPSISQSQQTNITNGRYSQFQINSYTVQLVAKKLGKLLVP